MQDQGDERLKQMDEDVKSHGKKQRKRIKISLTGFSF
jgi:hypothetical protein